jgi:hypothetical protein
VVAPSPSSFTDWMIMDDFDKIENMHKNDHGLDIGDHCFFMVYGWMPIECIVKAKQNTGMTRSFRLELVDKRSGGRRNGSWSCTDEWQYEFVTSVRKIAPIP